jgi:hypothetical protein
LVHPASTPASQPDAGGFTTGDLGVSRTGLALAACRELAARLRQEVVSFLPAPELLDAHCDDSAASVGYPLKNS